MKEGLFANARDLPEKGLNSVLAGTHPPMGIKVTKKNVSNLLLLLIDLVGDQFLAQGHFNSS